MGNTSDTKQQTPFIKSKVGEIQSFKTPEFIRTRLAQPPLKISKFGVKNQMARMKYGPSSVRTQHKGGGGK